MIWTREEMDRLACEAADVVAFVGEDPGDIGFMFAACYGLGAAVAFGLMAMAEAIRDRRWQCELCDGLNPITEEDCDWCGLEVATRSSVSRSGEP